MHQASAIGRSTSRSAIMVDEAKVVQCEMEATPRSAVTAMTSIAIEAGNRAEWVVGCCALFISALRS